MDPTAIQLLATRNDAVPAIGLTGADLERAISDREVFVARSGVSISAGLMRRASLTRLVVRARFGLANLDVEFMRAAGIRLALVPGPGVGAVADMTFGLILAVGRRITEADRLVPQGRWAQHELAGRLLAESSLSIIGLGSIRPGVGRLGSTALDVHERADEGVPPLVLTRVEER